MARNLIGTVTTDSNGEATFTYTGGGLGRIGFSAEHGTFQSEPYSVWDVQYYDTGVTGTTMNYKWKNSSTATTVTDAGTVLNAETFFLITGSESYEKLWSAPFVVEFDIVNHSGTARFQMYDGTNQFNQTLSVGHFKVVAEANKVSIYKDGSSTPLQSLDTTFGASRVGFQTLTTAGALTFKNWFFY